MVGVGDGSGCGGANAAADFAQFGSVGEGLRGARGDSDSEADGRFPAGTHPSYVKLS